MSKEKLFKTYLSSDNIDYAILINGEWGAGKTYYYEKYLKEIITGEGKIPIKVSLYGKDSTQSILNEITYNIFQECISKQSSSTDQSNKLKESIIKFNEKCKGIPVALGNKIFTHGSEMLSNTMRDKLGIESVFDLYEDFSNIVLVLDDFERCKIDIVELLGFISDFLEKGNIKIIVIANEKEITITRNSGKLEERYNFGLNLHKLKSDLERDTQNDNQDKKKIDINKEYLMDSIKPFFDSVEQYNKMKEKVFGYTITINPNISNTYESIIESYKEDKYIYELLTSKKSFILEVYSCIESNNLRILKRSLDVIQVLLNEIKNNLESISSDEIKEVVENYIISFSIIFYHIEKLQLVDLDKNIILYETEEIGFSYIRSYHTYIYNTFVQPLKSITDIVHIKSIVYFIINGELNSEELIKDISICEGNAIGKTLNVKGENKKDVAEKVFEFDTLEEDIFNQYMLEFIKNIEDGAYKTECYKKIIQLILILDSNELLECNKDEIVNSIKKGIYKSSSIEGKIIFSHTSFNYGLEPDLVTEINRLVNHKIEEINSTVNSTSLKVILDKFNDNFDEGIDMLNKIHKNEYNLFFAHLDIKQFVDTLKGLNNNQISQIIDFIYSKYRLSNLTEFYIDEMNNIEILIEELNNWHIEDKIKRFNIRKLIRKLEDIIENINKNISQ